MGRETVRLRKRRGRRPRLKLNSPNGKITQNTLQRFDSSESTALHAMGADSLSKISEMHWEDGKVYGVGEINSTIQTDLAEVIAHGTLLAWRNLQRYDGELEKNGDSRLGKTMANCNIDPNQIKSMVNY